MRKGQKDPAEMTASFCRLIRDVIEGEGFCKMRAYKHHLHGSTYEHSIKVAYLCYRHYWKHRGRVEPRELTRAALLHDYFLYDHHDKQNLPQLFGWRHLIKHPEHAANNAKRAYPDLSKSESDAIRHHMFPLTPIPPKTRCGWLVCWYDKVAAIGECFNRSHWIRTLEGSALGTLLKRAEPNT